MKVRVRVRTATWNSHMLLRLCLLLTTYYLLLSTHYLLLTTHLELVHLKAQYVHPLDAHKAM